MFLMSLLTSRETSQDLFNMNSVQLGSVCFSYSNPLRTRQLQGAEAMSPASESWAVVTFAFMETIRMIPCTLPAALQEELAFKK